MSVKLFENRKAEEEIGGYMTDEIVCTRGVMKGRRWAVTPQGLKIGRADGCDISRGQSPIFPGTVPLITSRNPKLTEFHVDEFS